MNKDVPNKSLFPDKDADTMKLFVNMVEDIHNPKSLDALMSMCNMPSNLIDDFADDLAEALIEDPSIHDYKRDPETGEVVYDEDGNPIVLRYVTEAELHARNFMLLSRSIRIKDGENMLTDFMVLTSDLSPGHAEESPDRSVGW